ncbi:MAG: 3-hydroxybutyrate oligomer hydrolase family protein [Marinicella pacifica]
MKSPLLFFCTLLTLTACQTSEKKTFNPSIDDGSPLYLKKVYYDGQSDDLLTAGLSLPQLRAATGPEISDNPTASELRRSAYYHQFKALNDVSETGGFGRLYGFEADTEAVPGTEYWHQRSVADNAYHTLVVQIPDSFNRNNPCLLVAPSSGSRHVLGSVATTGTWGLMNNCAVVYTDKGTGTQMALDGDQVYAIDGTLVDADNPLAEATRLPEADGLQVIQKQPFSGVHPEQYWGAFVLDATRYGLAVLNAEVDSVFNSDNVTVMAASISNGGGAVIRAAEIDKDGLIDAVVAAEPQLNMDYRYQLKKNGHSQSIDTLSLIELGTLLGVYEPCAALHPSLNNAPFKANTALIQPWLMQRCLVLQTSGLLPAGDTDLPAAAMDKLLQAGITTEALAMAQINTLSHMWAGIGHTYVNSYLQTKPEDQLCGVVFSGMTQMGQARALTEKEIKTMFAKGNGIAPSNGVEVAGINADGEPDKRLMMHPNFGFAAQQCLYNKARSQEMASAIKAIQVDGDLDQTPTIILHGTADGTVAINHASRAYFTKNQSRDNANQNLRFYEIENVQHFDAFLAYPGFNARFVPMHPYLEQALDMMWAYLKNQQPLPPSQYVSTQVRLMKDTELAPLSAENIPPISAQPTDLIEANHDVLEYLKHE